MKIYIMRLLAAAGLFLVAAPAYAAVTPMVTNVVHNSAHSVITSALVGTSVHSLTTVASSSGPMATGTVDFIKYDGPNCTGVATTQSGVALSSASAESNATLAALGGTSFKVHYNGNNDYNATDSGCASLTVNQYAPTVSLGLSSTTALAGTLVYASSTLSSASSTAGGSVAYRVYTNNTCTTLYQSAGTMAVTNAVVPNSSAIQFNIPGSYWWQAVYGGDTNNSAATSTCVAGLLTVIATTSTPNPGTGIISGVVYEDLNRNEVRNSGEAGLAGFTIELYKLNTGWKSWKNLFNKVDVLHTAVSDASGNYSFGNLADGTYSLVEVKKKGWKQVTDDYNKVVISNGSVVGTFDFGNASTTKSKKDKKDKEKDGDESDNDNGRGNSKQYWDWKFNGNFFKNISKGLSLNR